MRFLELKKGVRHKPDAPLKVRTIENSSLGASQGYEGGYGRVPPVATKTTDRKSPILEKSLSIEPHAVTLDIVRVN